jgi:hypothetical protein
MPIQSPVAIGPTSLLESRTAWVTSPVRTASMASAISTAFSAASASGSYTISAASASGIVRVGTTTTVFDVRASTCSATGMMFLLLGSITTWSALTCSTTSSSSAVDGFSVWPPVTMPCTFRFENSSASPSPLHTATTAVVTGGSPAPARLGVVALQLGLAQGVLLGDLLEQVGHPDLLRPATEVERDLDGGADVVGVDVAVPQAVAADDDDRVADRSPPLLEGLDARRRQVEEVHDLVALLAHVELSVDVGVAVRDGRELLLGETTLVGRFGQRLAVDDVERRVEEQEIAGATGVDDACVLQHRQQIGRAVERVLAGRPGGSDHVGERRPSADATLAASADSRTTVRIVPSIGLSTAW